MYVGNDGKLYAEWLTGAIAPISSAAAVDDGLWHHAVLTGKGTTQSLYLDGRLQGSLSGTISLTFASLTFASTTYLTFGAGYIGSTWPNEPYYQPNSVAGSIDYFTGQLAAITFSQ